MNEPATEETYTAPAHGWTCFHCSETFTTIGAARDHFGTGQDAKPGCILKVELGGERGMLMEIRKVEAENSRLRMDIENESSSTVVYNSKLERDINAFRPFRGCRSLWDVFNRFDSMEGRALAAEELATAAKDMAERTLAEGVSILNELHGLKPDALRWRALLTCGRMSWMGRAGFNGDQGDYRHITINFWSIFDHEGTVDESTPAVAKLLTEFADVCVRLKGVS